MSKKIVLLYSGGIDSTVLLFKLLDKKYDVYPLYINYGQKSFRGEFNAVNHILNEKLKKKLLKLDLQNFKYIGVGTLFGEYPNNLTSIKEWNQKEFFPNRNMIFISIAAAYCYKIDCSKIGIGLVDENTYKDTKQEFVEKMNGILNYTLDNVEIIAPYVEKSKREIVEEGVKLNVPFKKTYSCNSKVNKHCMLCSSCSSRVEALNILKELKANKM